jgi:type IV secretory pathway TraG/TraD family ATPase VirD4
MPVSWLPLAVGLLAVTGLQRARGTRRRDTHRRGALIDSGRRFGVDGSADVTLAGNAIAVLDETKHFKLIGTTGTGKSTAIRELLACALQRGDRAVISDPDGGYLARFGQPYRGDVVLNPFQSDSLRWDPFSELLDPYDADQLAGALIPTSADAAAQEWRGYGRTFVSALLRRCRAMPRPNVAEFWRLLAVASIEELRPMLAGTSAQSFLDPDNARMFGSIRSVAVSAAVALEYIQAQRAAPFSVRAWIREGRGALFIPYRASQIAALRSIIAAWLRLAIFEAMSQSEGRDQRLWFVVDELDALGAIDGLKDALARLRKFGGRCVLGFQSVAQVSSIYGQGDAQTIIENCGNTLVLRCSGSEQGGTSQFASRRPAVLCKSVSSMCPKVLCCPRSWSNCLTCTVI